MGVRFGLQKHFLLKREFDIISDDEFSKSNQIFEAAIVELKQQGFGRVDHNSPISKEVLEKIQSSYNPSSPDPNSLQQVVWFNIMFHLIRCGRENLRHLTKESSVLLKVLSQLALQLWRCMSRQVKILLVEAQCKTPL